MFTSNCPICKLSRTYKTKCGWKKGINKPCISCSNSLKAGGTGVKYVDDKISCSKCKQTKTVDDFNFKQGNIPYSYCKDCNNKASSKFYKEKSRFSKYGITKEDYDKLLTTQENKCGGCNLEMVTPYIDHCHQTGKVRGLLCQSCNTALGLVKDSPETLKNLIEYLKGVQ
jgi:hypothetical protein